MTPYNFIPYTGEARQPSVLACGIIFCIVTPMVVALRFHSRISSRVGLWWDDWLALIALPMALAFNAIKLWEITLGFGAWPSRAAEENLPIFLKTFYCLEILYNTSLPLCKMSILLLYRRVFPTWEMKWFVWILGGLVVAWFLGTEFTIIFQCKPIRKAWYAETSGTCWNLRSFLLGQGIPSIITDFLILLAPLPSVSRLHMPLNKKIAVSCIFLLGSFAVICSVTRMPYAMGSLTDHRPDHIMYIFTPGDLWTDAELQVCLICACLATIRPTISRCSSRLFGIASGKQSTRRSGSQVYWRAGSIPNVSEKKPHDDDEKRLTKSDATIAGELESSGGLARTGALGREDIEMGDLAQLHNPNDTGRVLNGESIGIRRETEVYADEHV